MICEFDEHFSCSYAFAKEGQQSSKMLFLFVCLSCHVMFDIELQIKSASMFLYLSMCDDIG